MATSEANTTDLTRAEILWRTADTLRGQIDAAEYKHVVLGLIFLKYIPDSFEARRDDSRAELEADGIRGPQLESLPETRDEFIAEHVFWVPPESRWQNLQYQVARPEIASLIDDAILAIERDHNANYILADPPFNFSDWAGKVLTDDVPWRYGTPPVGNANYAWIQHFIHHLAPPNGRGSGVAGPDPQYCKTCNIPIPV